MDDQDLLIPGKPVLLINNEPAVPSTSSRVPVSETNNYNQHEHVGISHPNHWLQKIVALTLMCVLGFGMLNSIVLHWSEKFTFFFEETDTLL